MNYSGITNGMYGLIVGDALGVPVEFMDRGEIEWREQGPVTGMEGGGTYNMPAGTWSDDSSMALATLDSIKKTGTIDLKDIMDRFVLWDYKGKYTPDGFTFDVGRTCDEAIIKYKKTGDVTTCGRTGENANGNGALMRILPVSVFWANKQMSVSRDVTESAIISIELVGALTHNHIRSGIACGIHYFITKNILMYKDKLSLNEMIQKGIDEAFDYYSRKDGYNSELVHYEELSEIQELRKYDSERIVGSGYVVESLIAAIWCIITTDTFKDCVLKAVNLGDDTDTTAAIAGGLAGLYYGHGAVPSEWCSEIKGKKVINNLIWSESIYEDAVGYDEDLYRKYEGIDKWDIMSKGTVVQVVGYRNSTDKENDAADFEVFCRMMDSFWVADTRYKEMPEDYVLSVFLGAECIFELGADGLNINEEKCKDLVEFYEASDEE